jgi:uncharacterized protein YoaH (UPF0181 family)
MNTDMVIVSRDVPDVSDKKSTTIYQRTDRIMAEQAEGKTLGQQYYEEVEALKSQGMSNADAIRQVAKKHDKKENAVRGGLHQYKTKLNGGEPSTPRRNRSAKASVDDLLASARQSLETAVVLIDQEVADAKAALDAAQAHYDEVLSSVKDRKADIEKKLKALA